MKYIAFFLLVGFLTACSSKEDSEKCHQQKYEQEFQTRIGELICFPDGNSMEVKVISDEFCCCFCFCAWEGELEIMVETTNPVGDKELLSFGSSTFNLKDKIFDGSRISKIDYLYNGEPDSLPLCEGEYDQKNVELSFIISQI